MAMRLCSKCKKRPAVVFITRVEGDKSIPEGYCISCAKELGVQPINDMLQKINIPDEDLEAMNEQLMQMMDKMGDSAGESDSDDEDFMPGGAATFPFIQELFSGGNEDVSETSGIGYGDQKKEKAPNKKEKTQKQKRRKYLDSYCSNLTMKARMGTLDRIVGRERELYRVIQILSRRTKNNPCLIGEPGVGKTAIAEGLALKIAQAEVPAKLMDKEIYLLDLTALVAGTQFRGQFESRVKGLVDEVKSEGDIILFIDEVHNLVGTGDAEGSMNAANILKPALSRGEIQVIGATTFNEYRKYIEKDAALERRFQPVTVEEPSISDTIKLLKGIKSYYEDFHKVKIPDAILTKMVNLSERYITDRFLPDKAIDLMDEAASCARLRNTAADDYELALNRASLLQKQEEEMEAETEHPDFEKLATIKSELARQSDEIERLAKKALTGKVTDDDLAKVIELWTGIPAAKVKESDLRKLAGLEDRIKEKIIGQDEAVGVISAAVRRSRVQISTRRKPASFIFVGPTGVGKTELVRVLAKELFDTPETLIRLDMSEFMEKHSVSRIIGAPPGYVGYDEAGQLTEKIRRKPYSVILFDEIEKAHPDVLNILLQILDDGHITDAQGHRVNFENTIIVMTSNAGSDKRENVMGFGKSDSQASREKVMKALKDFLRPEFISRVDEIVVFDPLAEEDYIKIAKLILKELVSPLEDKGITFSWDEDAPKTLAKEAYGGIRGARDLRVLIRRKVENKIAEILVKECDNPPTVIKIMGGEDISITYL